MIHRTTAAVLVVAVLCAAPSALAADALSNSYWDAAYLNSTVEAGIGTTDIEGFRLGASLGLAKFLNFSTDYDQRRYRNGREGFASAGLAYHTQNPVYQFHGGVSYERIEGDNNTDSTQDFVEDGYGVELGARYAFPNVAVHAAYRYLDFGTVDTNDTVDFGGARYGAGADVQLSPWWSLAADYRVREHKLEGATGSTTVDYNEWTVGVRRYFATDTDRLARHGGLLGGGSE